MVRRLVVIILEGAGQLVSASLLLCVFLANKFASFIGPSQQVSWKEVVFHICAAPPEEACVNAETEATLTSDICAFYIFPEIERVSNIEEILKTTTHNGFPIIRTSEMMKNGWSDSSIAVANFALLACLHRKRNLLRTRG